MAALLGGTGAVVGVVSYQGVPELLGSEFLRVRFPNVVFFLLMVFGVGFGAGLFGHFLFVHVLGGPVRRRAVAVGSFCGLLVALKGWIIARLFDGIFFPLHPFPGMEALMGVWLRNALIAGPVTGLGVALLVAGHLERLAVDRVGS